MALGSIAVHVGIVRSPPRAGNSSAATSSAISESFKLHSFSRWLLADELDFSDFIIACKIEMIRVRIRPSFRVNTNGLNTQAELAKTWNQKYSSFTINSFFPFASS